MTSTQHTRLQSIDFLRSLAILGMIIFHFAFIAEFLDLYPFDTQAGFWLILARFVQITFLTLVGVSLSLSCRSNQQQPKQFYTKQIKRGLIILTLASLITVTTFIFTPTYYIKFGILHLIGLSILAFHHLARTPKIAAILALVIATSSPFITSIKTTFTPAYILGLNLTNSSPALDYFPIFPWITLILIGITIGSSLKINKPKTQKPSKPLNLFLTIGRHSLLIYMTHVPIILAAIYLYAILTQSFTIQFPQ